MKSWQKARWLRAINIKYTEKINDSWSHNLVWSLFIYQKTSVANISLLSPKSSISSSGPWMLYSTQWSQWTHCHDGQVGCLENLFAHFRIFLLASVRQKPQSKVLLLQPLFKFMVNSRFYANYDLNFCLEWIWADFG